MVSPVPGASYGRQIFRIQTDLKRANATESRTPDSPLSDMAQLSAQNAYITEK